MTAPSQKTYLRTEQGKKSRPLYGGKCGKNMLNNIATPVTEFKRKTNPLAKRLRKKIKIQEPSRYWEISHMNWVTGLPPGGDRSYNECLVILDRLSKTQIFFPCHKDDTDINTALLT
ncbi:hypothetical protein O181_008533 [Austropuccinia psidii MF-1]|uniref:Uncharacterized protein n=1 Tax=Austropuccinia psidii MF-1 TaxID=1389203 RepID=A0A9Q3GIL0_9BASI|nr:hypothetical protein [Austropuccinia psidii MF-1]